jgi:hypothetical protein
VPVLYADTYTFSDRSSYLQGIETPVVSSPKAAETSASAELLVKWYNKLTIAKAVRII